MKPLQAFSKHATRTQSAAINGGMEIGLTILLFVLLGLAIDSWLGTKPVFVIGLFLFSAIAVGIRYYYAYTYDMERLEAEHRAVRAAQRQKLGGRWAQSDADADCERVRPSLDDMTSLDDSVAADPSERDRTGEIPVMS